MIELTIYNFISQNTTVKTYMEIPKNPASSFYVIEKTGSERVNHVDSSTIVIQSYAPSMYEAATLNDAVKAIMLGDAILELGEICNVELNTDYNFTDETAKKYRYQAVFDVTHY